METAQQAFSVGCRQDTARKYAEDLDDNVDRLLLKLQSGRYQSSPLRRVYIEKSNGKRRGLGLPTLEDKLAQ